MITLFRRIRQKLIESGSATKYTLYAVGEILLVVAGILIALQVNNWNEQRKANQMEAEVYGNLLTSLEQDSIEVQKAISLHTLSMDALRQIIINDDSEWINAYNDEELDKLASDITFGAMSFFPKTGVYNLIISNNGMDLLKSNDIKPLLINLYDFQYKRYENVDALVDRLYSDRIGYTLRTKIEFLVEYNPDFNIVKSVDRDMFIEHYSELAAACRDFYGPLSTSRTYLKDIAESINELLPLIRQELHQN